MKKTALQFLVASLLFILGYHPLQAQEPRLSTTYIDTYYNGEKHFSIKDASYIFCSPGNSEIYLVVNFADLKCGIDSLDEWLLDLTDSKLIFKGHLPSGDLLQLSHHNTKSLAINGEIVFNGVKHTHTVLVNFFEISKEGMLYNNNSQDYFDRVAVNAQFTILPKDFGIHKKPHHLKKKISVAIGKGIVNEYKTEHDSLIK